MAIDVARVEVFRYVGFEVDEATHTVRCTYALDDWSFTETITVTLDSPTDPPALPPAAAATRPTRWTPAAYEAARILFLLTGISYYKAAAPLTIDLGTTDIRDGEAEFLRTYYCEGLGEFAYRNDLDLSGLKVVGGVPQATPVAYHPRVGVPLAPFGGGIDSIVTAELLRTQHPDLALFVVSRAGDQFDAIEAALSVAALPVVRAGRELDPEILRSAEHGFRNGHVPVTGILSAIAVLAAVLDGRDAVVMSNEASASAGNVVVDGREINHQWSKSMEFETAFRALLSTAFDAPPEYFSLLRAASELWIARSFAGLRRYHGAFRSCNRAFHIDRSKRLKTWCGECDKCCFIDLVLAPFLPEPVLREIFGGREPLANTERLEQFRTLIGVSELAKPFECVGDIDECRAAVVLASDRLDHAGNAVLAALEHHVGVVNPNRLLRPMGPHHIPDGYAPRS